LEVRRTRKCCEGNFIFSELEFYPRAKATRNVKRTSGNIYAASLNSVLFILRITWPNVDQTLQMLPEMQLRKVATYKCYGALSAFNLRLVGSPGFPMRDSHLQGPCRDTSKSPDLAYASPS